MFRKKGLIYLIVFNSLLISAQDKLKVSYRGLKRTKSAFIEKVSIIKDQTQLDTVKIEKDLQNLIRLPSIAEASYRIETDSKTLKKRLVYDFVENHTLIPVFQLWTAVNQVSFRLGLKEFNLLGKYKEVGGFYQYNGFHSFGATYKDPFLFSNKLGVLVDTKRITTIEPLYKDDFRVEYQYTISSLQTGLLYQPTIQNSIYAGVTLFEEHYKYHSGTLFEGAPFEYKPFKLLTNVSHDYYHLDYDYYFLEGWKNSTLAQLVPVSPDQSLFWTLSNDISYFKRWAKRGNWATRLRVGFSNNNPTPFSAFAIDNNQNIRGIGNLVQRASAVLALNTEYRHTLFEKGWFVIQSNVFADLGAWRLSGNSFDDFTNQKNQAIFSGAGIRLIHKKIFNAILRIDYGFNLKEMNQSGLVFGIGQYF